MKIVADIHIHSHFSRATSKALNFESLSRWAQLKGVHVVGTGDIAHPGWLEEMKNKLEPAEEGLFRLKEEFSKAVKREVFKACQRPVRFMLAGEISNIYKKNDKVRKIHNLAFLPSFEAVEKLQATLDKIGNIHSDGRPILGLDSRNLLEILLDTDPQAYLIPAHIWTPWFSLLGSMSGFDSVEECFDDLSPHIFALETGLSSDPPMNWRLSALDKYTLVSNSDAHSPQKLAREANLFNTDLSYPAIFHALKTGDQNAFWGTFEFFPEEGKYHFDGHRKCGIRWNPKSTIKNNMICTECGKPVTVGVMHRVEILADREFDGMPPNRHPFKSLIPLPEILAEIHNVGVNTKRVKESYNFLLSKLGPELEILLDVPLEELEKSGGTMLAEAIRKMRAGKIEIAAGYDGEFGTIRVFDEKERSKLSSQLAMFEQSVKKDSFKAELNHTMKVSELSEPIQHGKQKSSKTNNNKAPDTEPESMRLDLEKSSIKEIELDFEQSTILKNLNREQREAVKCTSHSLIIVAGPGTGKTRTLAHRIAYLIQEEHEPPEKQLALTFTNKAAQEMVDRLNILLDPQIVNKITLRTFHALGAMILREDGQQLGLNSRFCICTKKDQMTILKAMHPSMPENELKQIHELISQVKNQTLSPELCQLKNEIKHQPEFSRIFKNYQNELLKNKLVDFDDLIFLSIQLFEQFPEILKKYQNRFQWIFVDEYQDLNYAQYKLLLQLVSPESNLCVIGDPDQAIYGFRGADRAFFLKFKEDFPQAKTVHLSRNYRSAQIILDASSQIISKSQQQNSTKTWSDIISQTKLEIFHSPTDRAEAEYVVHQIEKMMGGTSYFSLDSGRVGIEDKNAEISFGDIAVLYRLNAQSLNLEKAFRRSGIPFQTIGETPFYERKLIKELLSYLWFLYNPESDYHLQNILSSSQTGLSLSSKRKITSYAQSHELSLWEALLDAGSLSDFGIKQMKFVSDFINNLKLILSLCKHKTVEEIIDLVISNFYSENFFTEDVSRKKLIRQLILKSKSFNNRLVEFLESTLLRGETDAYEQNSDRVTLMTLHAAKGLEFPVVFIVGCEEYLIPYRRNDKHFDLEEERRLFYVGMTRAKHKLIIINSKSRYLFGRKIHNPSSRFLNDIENNLKHFNKMQFREKRKVLKNNSQTNLFS